MRIKAAVWRTIANVMVLLGLLALFAGSLPQTSAAAGGADKLAAKQVKAGNEALAAGDLGKARAAFDRALVMSPDYVDAFLGQATVALGQRDYDLGFTFVERGMAKATNKEKHQFLPVLVRLHTARKTESWYDEVNEIYYDAQRRFLDADGDPNFRLACGVAALEAGEISSSIKHFRVALSKKGDHVVEAEQSMQRAQKILRANLGNSKIKAIAVRAAITRRDVAILLFEEFDLPKFLPKADLTKPRAGEQAADGSADYAQEKVAGWIRAMHRLSLREFSIKEGKFRPNDEVTREEFAMLLEDLIIRRYGDRGLGRKFIGSASPYPDLAMTRASFNAMTTAISRGLMTTNVRGNADPTGAINGADAVIALRNLRGLVG